VSVIWQNASYRKLVLAGLGMVVIVATSSPQTSEVANAYLAQRGYTGISVKTPGPYHGRGPKHFPFEARTKAGARVSGELSMGSFAWFYTIRLSNPQPQ
jgi:hypothetical protein